MKLAVACLAAFGFVVSAVAHVAAIHGIVLGGEGLMLAYFCGVFVVFFPAVVAMQRKFPKPGPHPTWSDVLRYCPASVRILFYTTFLYALANFIFLMLHDVKTKHRSGDPLTAESARGFSGHAMAFYVASAAILLSLHREERQKPPDQG